MKSISFKNFRRFADFPEFKFGDITILVGGNNAGKSTLQKAILLAYDNLFSFRLTGDDSPERTIRAPKFRFDASTIHDLNLGTFERSIFAGAENRQIEFSLCINRFYIRMGIEPLAAGEDIPEAKVALIEMLDSLTGTLYSFNFNTQKMAVSFKERNEASGHESVRLKERIAELKSSLKNEMDPESVIRFRDELSKLNKYQKSFENKVKARKAVKIEINLQDYSESRISATYMSRGIIGLPELIKSYIRFLELDDEHFSISGRRVQRYPTLFEGKLNEADMANKQLLMDYIQDIWDYARYVRREFLNVSIYYIQAHGIVQKLIYTIDDKNDFIAQTIHKFASRGITIGDAPDTFIKKWMREFEIGKDYKIDPFGGAGYTVRILTNDVWINLSDMGMGTNQLMLLLFSLGTIMHQNDYSDATKLIIIEEPEQNLHPRLQSKLADLFAEVTKDASYKFLVETHSEYLIRRTQVIVAEMNLTEEELKKQNPFKVYYFPSDEVPYDMGYMTSGRFENAFGHGFIDESSKSAIAITKLERAKQNG